MSKTVLVVDDEEEQRAMIRSLLEQEGLSVLEAATCGDARGVHGRHLGHVDLLLIDISLPGGSGYDLFVELLELEPHLKVLFISGQAGAEFRKFAHSSAASHRFLQKPFEPAQLVQAVRLLLENSATA